MDSEERLLTITSFRVDYPFLKEGEDYEDDFPFCIVNATFKIDKQGDYGTHLWNRAVADSKDYVRNVVVEDPEKTELWYLQKAMGVTVSEKPESKMGWVLSDPKWRYLEKFDTFWFREWIAYSSVTEAVIQELRNYYLTGKLSYSYRTIPESIILKHFETLESYWD